MNVPDSLQQRLNGGGSRPDHNSLLQQIRNGEPRGAIRVGTFRNHTYQFSQC